jgi:hypothetical protein
VWGRWSDARRAVGASILARFKLSPRQFVLGVKLFEMQVSALRASDELGVAYRTAWKLFTVLPQALAKAEHGQELLVGEVEGEESSLTHFKTAAKAAIIWAILKKYYNTYYHLQILRLEHPLIHI